MGLSSAHPADICGTDPVDLPNRVGGISPAFKGDLLWGCDSNRDDFAAKRPRPFAAQGTLGQFSLEKSGWQKRCGWVSSAELMNQKDRSRFEEQAAKAAGGFFTEFWIFLKENKKWWLLPILLAFLLMGALLLAGGTGAAPFIYTLF